MSDQYHDFKEDFLSQYSELDLIEVEAIIDIIFDKEKDSVEGVVWSATVDIEKIHQLQENVYIHIYQETETDDIEINLTYASGIDNNGLVDYSLDGGGGVPAFRTVSVLDDLKLDRMKIQGHLNLKKGKDCKVNWNLAQMMLDGVKEEILEIYKKESYDNYFTGGGTMKTRSSYKDQKQLFHDRGIYWECIYKEIKVDINLK